MQAIMIAAIAALLAVWYTGSILLLFRGLLSLRSFDGPRNASFSVIVAARNEEANVESCIKSLLSQTLPVDRYEIIIVNDRSTDRTADLARSFCARHRNISVVTIEETPPGVVPKKYAVMTGIRHARHQIMVLTDADCLVPPTWLESIDRCFDETTGMVQGITVYARPAGMSALFFGLQALDFLSHGVVAAAAVGAGLPLNANANNLAFRKDAYDAVGGYARIDNIVSGDDDLLLQRFHKSGKWRIRYMIDPAGAVTTQPTPTIRGILEQRKRWGSIMAHYGAAQTALLAGIFLFYLSILASFIGGVFGARYLALCGLLIILKLLGEALLLWPGTRIFRQQPLRRYLIPASLLQLPLVIYAVFAGVFGRFAWKNQEFARTMKATIRSR
jgi:cellulose synthase/poly-beta-1,6-N-acetylglucosamine synthase-like glycosyltransferase